MNIGEEVFYYLTFIIAIIAALIATFVNELWGLVIIAIYILLIYIIISLEDAR